MTTTENSTGGDTATTGPDEIEGSAVGRTSVTVPAPRPRDPSAPEEQLLQSIAELAADRRAHDIVALDMRGVLGYTDFFLICTGNTDRQVKAIHDSINFGLKKVHAGLLPRHVEGLGEARWVLLDYLDVVVHIFTPEAREFYRLEQLWGEAERRTFEELEAEAAQDEDAPTFAQSMQTPAPPVAGTPAGSAGTRDDALDDDDDDDDLDG